MHDAGILRLKTVVLLMAGVAIAWSSFVSAQESELTGAARPGRWKLTIKLGEFERIAHLQIPSSYEPGTAVPVVLVFHGAGGNGRVILDHNGWAAKAEKCGFVAVAPDGLPAQPRSPANFRTNPTLWNSGQLRPRSPRAAIDDVAYVRQLLDELKGRVNYGPSRVFAAGHSNGASMVFRLATELPERLTAIGAVAGLVSVENPQPAKGLPTLAILGTKDPLMPIDGGEVQLPWGAKRNPPVTQPLAVWAQAIGCSNEPRTVSEKDGVKILEYPSEIRGPVFTVIMIEGHGHVWPGSKSLLPESSIGPITDKLNATDRLWDFFVAASAR
jgi:polyhydroxybutyrate depolymerase